MLPILAFLVNEDVIEVFRLGPIGNVIGFSIRVLILAVCEDFGELYAITVRVGRGGFEDFLRALRRGFMSGGMGRVGVVGEGNFTVGKF